MNSTSHPTLTLPDAPNYDWPALLTQWVPGDPYQPEPETPRYYATKAAVAYHLKPRRVVEIGVRAGYSALAMRMGWQFSEFYGIDMDEGWFGGVNGYLEEAYDRLSLLTQLRVWLHKADSQDMRRFPLAACHADLVHVDGDHSPKGTAHDILLAWCSGARWILVDDYDFSHHVRDGADWAIDFLKADARYVGDGGYRGNVLIKGRDA